MRDSTTNSPKALRTGLDATLSQLKSRVRVWRAVLAVAVSPVSELFWRRVDALRVGVAPLVRVVPELGGTVGSALLHSRAPELSGLCVVYFVAR